ncbi:hypothetical protein [Nocardia sp. NPDC051463]|uniref:hypothetical protein n=1 Tax=Nocardia sp. NPDC051463 TaxID=3154845 RepID=UPI0034278D62
MTAIQNQPTRIMGVEWGTATLALMACLIFTLGIAALTNSIVLAVGSGTLFGAGVVLTSKILPAER